MENMALLNRVLSPWKTPVSFGSTIGFVRREKHYNPKFKWHRGKKFIDPRLELFVTSTEKARMENLKRLGVIPLRPSKEIPLYIGSTNEFIDAFVPPPGDGSYSSVLSKVKDISVKESAKNVFATRKIKSHIKQFSAKDFVNTAQDVYIKAHEALASNKLIELETYTTERCYCQMTTFAKNKTVRWKFLESLDPPKTVHIRIGEILMKGNDFAQVTVRFHSKQMLAIYDRFGRLMYGSEILAKDVLEYAVFERHLTNMNGIWRLHGKILPVTHDIRYGISRTYSEDAFEEDESGNDVDEEIFKNRVVREYKEDEKEEATS